MLGRPMQNRLENFIFCVPLEIFIDSYVYTTWSFAEEVDHDRILESSRSTAKR